MRNRTITRFLPHAVLAALAVAAAGAGVALAAALPLPDGPHDFNSPGFVARHAWEKYAYLAARPLRDDLSEAEQETEVARYFDLTAAIGESERIAGDPASSASDAAAARASAAQQRAERATLENDVEATLEGWLTAAIEDAGLTRRASRDVVWPPADIEFEDPPAVLITSPRAEIRRDGESLVRGNLALDRVERIEADAERDGQTSALVQQISGVAMYPAIIPPSADYEALLRTAAHEWMHHYLYFTPLGRRYFAGGDLTTLNETIADIVGGELGEIVLARHPLPRREQPLASTARVQDADPVDFVAEMRTLRREVERLLAAGDIERAERLMEEKRLFLAEHGHYIRRLNQAYFAFHGSYADSAGSIDPIGPKLDSLRARSGSLADFVRTSQRFTSEDDLDRALR